MVDEQTTRRRTDRDLKTALIDAGVELLRIRGADGLSLRECATMAGVSHAAPGYHFKNIMGLSTAIAARGFQLFCEAMTRRLDGAGPSPRDRLSAICHGYIDYASDHPALFLFIFSGQKFNENDEFFCSHSERAYAMLREACAPFVASGTPKEDIEVLVWSLVHGYSQLSMTRKKENPKLDRSWPDFDQLFKHLGKALTPNDET
ncbi:AcrR family transcriptional regulator [Labrenzia sp. EL_142]|nr:AcrR family transcriptional regulator [Labrenzia sp. EL_142]